MGDRLEFESRLHGAAKAWPSYFTAHLPNEDHTAHLESLFRKSERNRVKSKAAVGTRGKKEAAVLLTILTHLHTSQLFGSGTRDKRRLGLRSREEVTDLVVSPPALPPLLNTQAPK